MAIDIESINNRLYEVLGVPKGDSWAAIIKLIAEARNYHTAVAWMFGLSWIDEPHNQKNRAYLRRAEEGLRKWREQSNFCPVDAEDVYNWMQWYVKNVEEVPSE